MKEIFKIDKPRKQKSKLCVYTEEDIIEKGYRDSIHLSRPINGRPLAHYETQLNFKAEDLQGMTILDLGASAEDVFATELNRLNLNTTVISLSPEYSTSRYAAQVKSASPEGLQVAGLGQALPFPNENFDRVFALHLLQHFINKEAYLNTLAETGRVLKPGGLGKMGFTQDIPHSPYKPFSIATEDESLSKHLSHLNVTLIREDIPTNIIPELKVKDGYGNSWYVPSYNIVLQKTPTE